MSNPHPQVLFARLTKYDESTGYFEATAASEAVDKNKEIFDYESSKPHFKDWSNDIKKASGGKSLGNLREMHGKVAAGRVLSMDFDDDAKAIKISGEAVDEGTKIKMSKGVLTGVSIGGDYAAKWPDTAQKGCIRYTAKPFEISLVDNPCNPDCSFTVVKGDGSSEMRKFQKSASAEDRSGAHEKKMKAHEDKAKAAKESGDKEGAKKHEAAAEAHKKAMDAHQAVADEKESADAEEAGKLSDAANEASETADAAAAEKIAVSELAKMFNAGTVKPSDILTLAKGKLKLEAEGQRKAKIDGLRKALEGEGLTNGDLERLAAEHLPEDERDGNAIELLGRLHKVAARDDVSEADKKRAEEDYGDVKFADEKNEKYPIGTEKEIRAAWNYINKKKNAAKYDAKDLKAVKDNIIRAWKKKIDKDGPPSAEKFVESLELGQALRKAYVLQPDGSTVWVQTGLSAVSSFAYLVQALWDAAGQNEMEQQLEGDTESKVPEMLEALATQAGEILIAMVEEEVGEEAETEAEKAALVGALTKKFGGDPEKDALAPLLAKYGARHSKEDAGRLQKIHDHSVEMGATCAKATDAEKLVKADADFGTALCKALGAEEGANKDDILKTAADAIRKAKLYDDMPAPPKGALKSLSKAQDAAGEVPSLSEEDEALLKAAEGGDLTAQVKVLHKFGGRSMPPRSR